MARPHKDSDTKRDFTIRIRVTPSEKKVLQKVSEEQGLSVSDFMRAKSISSTPLFRKATPERAAFIKGLAELGKVGSNVNQIARALNRRADNPDASPVPFELIDYALRGVETLSRHLLNLLQNGH